MSEEFEVYRYIVCWKEPISWLKKYKNSEQENQALKARWEKLKEWVKEFHRDVVAVYPKTLLDKIQELELAD